MGVMKTDSQFWTDKVAEAQIRAEIVAYFVEQPVVKDALALIANDPSLTFKQAMAKAQEPK